MTDPAATAPVPTTEVCLKTHAIIAGVQHLAGATIAVDAALAPRMIEDGAAELPGTTAPEPDPTSPGPDAAAA